MMRIYFSVAMLGMAAALAGCNETGGGPIASAPPPASPAGASTAAFSLPDGTPCANEIGRYQSVVKADLETGNVEQRVYDQIQREMARAAAACSAGKGGEAHRIVASSKSSHGYRAG